MLSNNIRPSSCDYRYSTENFKIRDCDYGLGLGLELMVGVGGVINNIFINRKS